MTDHAPNIEGLRRILKVHLTEKAVEAVISAVNEYQTDKEEIARLKKVIQEGKQYWQGFADGERDALKGEVSS